MICLALPCSVAGVPASRQKSWAWCRVVERRFVAPLIRPRRARQPARMCMACKSYQSHPTCIDRTGGLAAPKAKPLLS